MLRAPWPRGSEDGSQFAHHPLQLGLLQGASQACPPQPAIQSTAQAMVNQEQPRGVRPELAAHHHAAGEGTTQLVQATAAGRRAGRRPETPQERVDVGATQRLDQVVGVKERAHEQTRHHLQAQLVDEAADRGALRRVPAVGADAEQPGFDPRRQAAGSQVLGRHREALAHHHTRQHGRVGHRSVSVGRAGESDVEGDGVSRLVEHVVGCWPIVTEVCESEFAGLLALEPTQSAHVVAMGDHSRREHGVQRNEGEAKVPRGLVDGEAEAPRSDGTSHAAEHRISTEQHAVAQAELERLGVEGAVVQRQQVPKSPRRSSLARTAPRLTWGAGALTTLP